MSGEDDREGVAISRDEIRQRLADRSLVLVDVLPRPAFEEGHIPGSASLPLDDLAARAKDLLPDLDADIAVYCGGFTCPLSGKAARLLEDMGYTHVREYAGGIEDWTEAGLPLERAEATVLGSPSTPEAPRGLASSRLVAAAQSGVLRLADAPLPTLLVAWLGVILGAGVAYWLLAWVHPVLAHAGEPIAASFASLGTCIYFSFVTATSIGFGDVVPLGFARAIAVAEAIAGLLIFGAVVSKLVSTRQERLVEEIHRISFENRLGRVRTNLHLALSELRGLSRDAADGKETTERVVARVESATMVLAGELRAVHDLLYRPQDPPSEAMLEAILATMAEALTRLCELEVVHAPPSRMLAKDLDDVRVLASEICGSCVPQDHGPDIREWMDRIQALAERLEPRR